MKKLEKYKIISALAIIFSILFGFTVWSLADDDIQIISPDSVVNTSARTSSSTSDENNTSSKNNTTNSSKNNTTKNNTVTTSNSSNSSSYNNTNLPKTGIEDFSTLFIIIGVMIIIGVVAYKKAQYYRNV